MALIQKIHNILKSTIGLITILLFIIFVLSIIPKVAYITLGITILFLYIGHCTLHFIDKGFKNQ